MKDWLKQQLERSGLGGKTAEEVVAPLGRDEPLCVLLVDDAPANIQILRETLKPLGHRLLVAKDGATALSLALRFNPALILLDVMMPDMDGYEVCTRLKQHEKLREAAVIFCSALDDTEAKVKALRLGAVDFITKPFQPEEVIARVGAHLAVQQLAMSLQAQNRALSHELEIAREHQRESMRRLEWILLGNSNALHTVQDAVARFAEQDASVLLVGPLFCGDEAVARSIHGRSARRNRPFILVDCSRLTEADESSVFESRDGTPSKLELAHGGTLYLEHVQYLSKGAHDQLTACLEEKSVGVIAYRSAETLLDGSVAPLREVLSQNVLRLPALTERRDDILPMAGEVLARHARRLGKPASDFEAESMVRLTEHAWPGNLRELEDVVVRTLATSTGVHLKVDDSLLLVGISLGSYRLLDRLGAGGMGEVWRARHHLLARPAAVKLIRAQNARDADAVERFRLEATATSQLSSPHTVTLYDFGVSDGGAFYFVMELLEGQDLDTHLKEHGPVSAARMAHFLVQACKSLTEAHAVGLVHRDLKPSNLFVCKMGRELDYLKVLDFGLARQQLTGNEARLTQAGAFPCTPAYVAPETATQRDVMDGRTDIYSLGATAYHLLVGEAVFPGSNSGAVIMQHVFDTPPPIGERADVPAPLADLIMRCLSKELEERPTAEEMLALLQSSGLPQQWTAADAQTWWSTRRG